MSAPALAVVLWVVAAAGIAAADESAELPLPAPGRAGWETLTFRKIPRHTVFTPVSIDGREAVRAESRCAASALFFELDELELASTPVLEWEWKVERDLEIPDPRIKSGDDFAARVYVLFAFQPERATTWQRLRWRAARTLFGREVPGNALNYVWSSTEPAGSTWDNPYTESSKMISRGSGPLGSWRRERVDVLADHQALIGEPPRVRAVALMSDSDDSCQQATAYIANLRFIQR